MDFSALATNQPASQAEQSPEMEVTLPQKEQEPDFEELFLQEDPFSQPEDVAHQSAEPAQVDLSTMTFSSFASASADSSDTGAVLDLDAALGPWTNWESRPASFAARRPLHSSRLNRDFVGPGMHYHRRTESAPALAPFEFGRSASPQGSPMADVFEEEEEDEHEEFVTPGEDHPKQLGMDDVEQEEEANMGIQVVDMAAEPEVVPATWSFEDGLRIQPGTAAGRTSAFGTPSHLSTPSMGRRPSSIIEETIFEESSPVEVSPIEIVLDHEEPRASSLTKSSDSSDTPTLMPDNVIALPPPTQPTLMTPTTYAASTFSSPDFSRRQESFDTSRLGTSASSIADSRTMSSFAIGDSTQPSSDDVPSLTSSRSTMISTMHPGGSRRDIHDRNASVVSAVPPMPTDDDERRRKRSSIQSLAQLVGAPFSDSKGKLSPDPKSQTASPAMNSKDGKKDKKKKEHRLSRLMFWKSKNRMTSD